MSPLNQNQMGSGDTYKTSCQQFARASSGQFNAHCVLVLGIFGDQALRLRLF